mgnify:CR=1 FL=1
MTTKEMITNIIVGATVSTVVGLTAAGLLKHISNAKEAENTADDFRELKTINGDIFNAENIEDVVDAMHRANEIFARHGSDEKFRELNAKVMDRGTQKACELLEKEKKEA